MQRTRLHALVLVLLLAPTWACGGASPTAPSPPAVTLTAITIAPQNVSSAGLRCAATARYSDGTTRDVTQDATWASSNTVVAVVRAPGFIEVLTPGTTELSATYQGLTGRERFTFVP